MKRPKKAVGKTTNTKVTNRRWMVEDEGEMKIR